MLLTLFSVKTMESLQIRGAAPFWIQPEQLIPKWAKNTFKSALWTFKQQLTLKMRAHWGISNLAPLR